MQWCRRMCLRRQTGREDRRDGEIVRRQGARCDAYRSGPDRALPPTALRLQGAEGDPLSRFTAQVERRQDPAEGSTRTVIGASMTQYSMATAAQFAGRELGASEWIPIDQDRIDAFAACTGDRQWIHVDVERARRESPFGGPIAHGYLTLSLVAAMIMDLGVIPPDAATGLNYGLDKVRFIAPVRAGSRVRARAKLRGAEPQGDARTLLRLDCTLEIEGDAKPALVAELLCLLIGKCDAAA